MESIIASLAFWQILVIIGIILVFASGVILLLFSRGGVFRSKNTTLTFSSKKGAENLITILEAFKIKDDIHEIDHLVITRQKKHLKGKLPAAQTIQLDEFSKLQKALLSIDRMESYNPFEDRDYLYYSLLIEKVYSGVFRDLIDTFDHNAIETVANPTAFARSLASETLKSEFTIVDSMYLGVENIPKNLHDVMVQRVWPKLIDILSEGIEFAIRVAKRGAEKKMELKSALFEKAGRLDGISQDQLSGLFKDVTEDNFLDL